MNTNLVKAVQRAIGHESTGELTDTNLLDVHRYITGCRYVEPVEIPISEPGAETSAEAGPTKPHFTNHGQPA